MLPAAAMERLREGNRRYVSGELGEWTETLRARRDEVVAGQQPFAVVLGCSDSRVPVELVFNQGIGDLFVIRVAGNIAAPIQIGSIEYAVEHLGSRLVVVLGHSGCGAVTAALSERMAPGGSHSPHLRAILDRIGPAVDEVVTKGEQERTPALIAEAVRANTRAVVKSLQRESPLLASRIAADGLLVVGAKYDLESGVVEFLHESIEVE